MNTLKIKFLGISTLRIALKSQLGLAGVVVQNRQKTDLLATEQGETWAILNEICCFWVNTSSQVKESFTVLKKNIQILRISKNELESPQGGYSLSLGDLSPCKGEFGVG